MLKKISFALIMLICLISTGCSNKIPNPDYLSEVTNLECPDFNKIEKKQTGDFNFIVGFGIYSRNILNTFDGTFTKDLVKGFYTIHLKLSDEEMNLIEEKFRDIDILSYPDEFAPNPINPQDNTTTYVTPYSTYSLRIELDDVIKEIAWEDKHLAKEEKAIVLRELMQEIEQMVYQREDYKKMPMEKGGYD